MTSETLLVATSLLFSVTIVAVASLRGWQGWLTILVFVLGMAYVTALTGDAYALANPWRALTRALTQSMANGRHAYPKKLGHWPALLLYMGFIWSELFAGYTPQSLAGVLLGYTLLNMLAVYLVGARVWFHYGEFFSVMFRLLGRISPLAYRDATLSERAGWRWRGRVGEGWGRWGMGRRLQWLRGAFLRACEPLSRDDARS